RRYSHAPEKRPQRNFNAVAELRDHSFLVQRNHFYPLVRKILGQEAAPRGENIQRVRNRQTNFLNSDLQHVARLSPFDVDWSGQHMRRWAAILQLIDNFAIRWLDPVRPKPRRFKTFA